MSLHSTSNAKERILLIGREGTAKTYSWCSIAAWMRRTNTDGMVYVLDTDLAVPRMSDDFGPEFFTNITSEDISHWTEYTSVLDRFRSNATNNDWLVVDMIDKPWEAVQNYFIEEVHGKSGAEWFLEYRKEKSGHPLAGEFGLNWSVINKLYAEWMGKVQRWPGHVLAVAPVDQVQVPEGKRQGDSAEILEMYGKYGVKPKGQKSLGHQFHTVLLTTTKGKGWAFTSIKDRSRELVVSRENTDFVLSYLKPIGKWEIT